MEGRRIMLALDRIFEATVRQRPVLDTPPGFDVGEWMSDTLGVDRRGDVADVEIAVQPEVLPYIEERRWHPSAMVTRHGQETFLRMRVRINDELARFVVGLGPGVEVLTPPELRRMVAEQLRDAASQYGEDKRATT